MPESEPISMFCGLPVIVATLPMFDAVATAIDVRKRRQPEPPRHMQHERRHHQADDVVDQKRGEHAAA